MKKRKKNALVGDYEKRRIPVSMVLTNGHIEDWDKKELKTRAAYFLLNGEQEFSVNRTADGKYKLLALERDFFAAVSSSF